MGTEGELLSTEEVIDLLGISRTTLFKLMREKKIEPIPTSPLLKRPRRLRFRRADVERLMRQSPPTP